MFTNVSFYTNGFMLNEVKKPKTKAAAQNGAAPNGNSPNGNSQTEKAEPILNQQGNILQSFGTVLHRVPLALEENVRQNSVNDLNQILADTITLRDLYKKHHWQIVGPTFYQLHLLFDKHYEEQSKLVDEIAERIQLLGGLSLAMAADIAEVTRIPRPPKDREEVPVQISRLLEAHDLVLKGVREAAQRAAEAGDDGTNDLLVSQVLRTNELQAWFLYEHVVETPIVRAE